MTLGVRLRSHGDPMECAGKRSATALWYLRVEDVWCVGDTH